MNELAIQGEDNQVEVADTDQSLKHLILTGHKDGKVLVWRLQNYIAVLEDYGCEVTCMSKCFEGIAIATIQGRIFIWDVGLLAEQRVIDINDLPFKVLSSFIVSMDYDQRRMLVLTMNGDVIELSLNEVGSGEAVKAQRVQSVVRITCQSMKALTILTQIEQTIIVAGDNGLVSSYDISTHELIDVWHVGSSISSLAALELEEGGFVLAAGTDDGNIILR